jgi:carboxylesterase type B
LEVHNDYNKKLPVFIWIYGGGFSVGECSDPTYVGSAFAKYLEFYIRPIKNKYAL